MSDDGILADILAWLALIVLVCVYLLLLAAWESWREFKRKRAAMRQFWRKPPRRNGR